MRNDFVKEYITGTETLNVGDFWWDTAQPSSYGIHQTP